MLSVPLLSGNTLSPLGESQKNPPQCFRGGFVNQFFTKKLHILVFHAAKIYQLCYFLIAFIGQLDLCWPLPQIFQNPELSRDQMIARIFRNSCYGLIFIIGLPILGSSAQDSQLLEKLTQQELQIERQNQRIQRLENALESLLQAEGGSTPYVETNSQPEPDQKPSAPKDKETETAEGSDPFAGKSAPIKGYDPEKSFFGPLPRFTSPSGYSFGFSGFFQYDGALYGQDSSTNVPDYRDGTRLKSTSIFLTGVFPKDWIWGLYYNLADTGAIYRGFAPWWIMLGNQRSGVGLDPSSFSSARLFMEEAMPLGSFAFAPGGTAMGVSTLYREDGKYLRVGLLTDPAKEANSTKDDATSDEPYGIHARAAWSPVAERTKALHVGASGYWRTGGSTNFDSDPEITVDSNKLIDTGDIERVKDYYFAGLEAAWVEGPISLQGEYGLVNVLRKNNRSGQVAFQDLNFQGYYAQASYFLTGESRNYYSRFAGFWRVKPKNDFDLSQGKWGAWEVAARYSYLDLDDGASNIQGGGVRGGVANNYSLALNWHLNPFVKVLLNYVQSDVEKLSATGTPEGDVLHILGSRLQIEF